MANKQKEQSFLPIHGEIPIISTGYENKFGDNLLAKDSDNTVASSINLLSEMYKVNAFKPSVLLLYLS